MKKIKIITMDLETRTLNNIMEVISAALFDGINYTTFYLADYQDPISKQYYPHQLLSDAVKSLLLPKYNGYKVYLHNLSLFDAIFLFTHILDLAKLGYQVSFIKREDKFININIKKYKLVQDKKGN